MRSDLARQRRLFLPHTVRRSLDKQNNSGKQLCCLLLEPASTERIELLQTVLSPGIEDC